MAQPFHAPREFLEHFAVRDTPEAKRVIDQNPLLAEHADTCEQCKAEVEELREEHLQLREGLRTFAEEHYKKEG